MDVKTFFKKYRVLLICTLLAAATLALYWPAHNYEFINYDDDLYVYDNPHVKEGLNRQSVKWAFTDDHANMWHPLTTLSHILDCELFGLNPSRHHITNLLFHIANTLLLFIVLRKMTGCFWKSAFVAALFALHPLQVESVAWVAERKNVLSGFFWLLTIAVYVRYTEKPRVLSYLLVCAVSIMAMMSKPITVTLPFTLLLLDFWPLNRFQFSSENKISRKAANTKIILEKVPLLFFSAALCVITFIFQRAGGAVKTMPFDLRLSNAVVSYLRYIFKIFYPTKLAVFYPHPAHSLPLWQPVLSFAVLIAVTAILILSGKRRKYLITGWLWYLGILVPVLGIIQAGDQAMADRYMYLPSIGLFIILAWSIAELIAKTKYGIPLTAIAACIPLAAFTISTIQLSYWQNSVTLFEHAIKVTKDNHVAHNNLGVAYIKLARYHQAIGLFQQAANIDPLYADARANLGLVYNKLSRYEDAIDSCIQAIHIKADHPEAYSNLGFAYAGLGRYHEAIDSLKRALTIRPDDAKTYTNLGVSYSRIGLFNEAIASFKQAVSLNPFDDEAYFNLGLAYTRLGRYSEAVEFYQQAVKINPDYADAQNNLGNTYFRLGLYQDALEPYRQAVRIKPDFVEARYNLGVASLKIGDINAALAEYEVLKTLDAEQAAKLFNLINGI